MTSNTLNEEETADSLPQLLYASEEVKRWEGPAAEDAGKTLYELMESAGQAVFDHACRDLAKGSRLLILVGSGNNGGDALVVARLARSANYSVTCCAVNPDGPKTQDGQKAYQAFIDAGGQLQDWQSVNFANFDLIIDGLLGTGISGPLKPPYDALIEKANSTPVPTLAIDVPSGVDANSGGVPSVAMDAAKTVTLVAIKPGLCTGAGRASTGVRLLDDLGIAQTFAKRAIHQAQLRSVYNLASLPTRNIDSHKGNHGRLLCIGGNQGMAGAIRMCAEAALYSGTGLVKLLTHPSHRQQVGIGRPEIMVSTAKDCEKLLNWSTTIALGPGLGRDAWAHQLVQAALVHARKTAKPLVVDADALYWLATDRKLQVPSNAILTPHSGEAARLLDVHVDSINADRFAAASNLQQRYGGVIVLKGPGTIVECEHGTHVVDHGNPGMAVGGMGDVLTGTIAALAAQGMESVSCSALRGVIYHSAAADQIARTQGERGILATELLPQIRSLVNS